MKRNLAGFEIVAGIFAITALLLVASAAYLGYTVAPSPYPTSSFYAPAITANGAGALVKFTISLKTGNGRTLVNVQNALYQEDSESALLKAKLNAEKILGLKLTYYDVILDINAAGADVGGESAGALFAAGIVSAYTGKAIKRDVAISAGLNSDGSLFPVEGIEEKILAAKQAGRKKFIVAQGQLIPNQTQISEIEIIRLQNIEEALSQLLS